MSRDQVAGLEEAAHLLEDEAQRYRGMVQAVLKQMVRKLRARIAQVQELVEA